LVEPNKPIIPETLASINASLTYKIEDGKGKGKKKKGKEDIR
jgi:hypothetical protein